MNDNSSAESLKEKGNEYYKKRDYEKAVGFYSQSLRKQETAACYSNRSLCYIQLHDFTKAEIDATKSIHCDPLFVKAWLRRGICRISRKQIQLAYFDLLRADELNPNNKDIQKQLAICKEDKDVKQISLAEHIEELFGACQLCFEEGNTNEGISYMPDIYQLRPTDIPILERLATLVSTYHFWKEASYLYEKLYSLSKSLIHLQKRILADVENKEFKTALIGLAFYNSHCKPEEKMTSLEKELREKLSSSDVSNAMSILESKMELPANPTSIFEFLSAIQSLKHTHPLLLRYMQSISLELYEKLFIQADSDCDPYEVLIDSLHSILSKNISHCYWAMDVLKSVKMNPSFSFIKALLTSSCISKLRDMKQFILDVNKVEASLLTVFDDYLN